MLPMRKSDIIVSSHIESGSRKHCFYATPGRSSHLHYPCSSATRLINKLPLLILLITFLYTAAGARLDRPKYFKFKEEEGRQSRRHRLNMRLRNKSIEQDHSTQPDLFLTLAQIKAIQQPITVAIMSSHYFGSDYGHRVEDCNFQGVNLDCSYIPDSKVPLLEDLREASRRADAVWWHAPNTCGVQGGPWGIKPEDGFSPFKARPDQLAVLASMESSAYYRCLDDEDFMSNFDVEMTYRRRSEIPLYYWNQGYRTAWETQPEVSVGEKKDAVVFMNANCHPPSNRTGIVEALMRQPGIKVDALGLCLNNGGHVERGAEAKLNTFRQYKYCIAMENSIAEDYVSEKVYDALAAGCVPIYLGAANIADFVPSVEGVIDFGALGSVEALAAELRRLSADDAAYNAKLAWRHAPSTWGSNFLDMINSPKRNIHSQCQLCQIVALNRVGMPDPETGKRISPKLRQPLAKTKLLPFMVDEMMKIDYVLADAQ